MNPTKPSPSDCLKLAILFAVLILFIMLTGGCSTENNEAWSSYEVEVRRVDGSLDTLSLVAVDPVRFDVNTSRGSYWLDGAKGGRVAGIIDFRVISSRQFWPPKDSAAYEVIRKEVERKYPGTYKK
jgi:hypothetical protein